MAGAKRGGGGGREKGEREGVPSPSPQSSCPFSLPPYPLPPTPFDACYAGYDTSFERTQKHLLSDTFLYRLITSPRNGFRTALGTQREYSSKLLKHSIDKRILVFKR